MSKKLFSIKYDTISTNYPSGMIFDNEKQHTLYIDEVVNLLNWLNSENKELKLQLEAFKDKLCELGVSDVKLYGKRYYTGLEEWLE